jgi:hypothetical protein
MESETLSKRYHPITFVGAGRLALCRSQPQQAIQYYSQVMRAQSQYRNLHHIRYWEMAIAHLALWDVFILYPLFFSGQSRFIRMEWLFLYWRVGMMTG